MGSDQGEFFVCRGCGERAGKILLEAGELPVSNGYIGPGESAPKRPLTLGRCNECSLLQLVDPFPASVLQDWVPDWVRYKEPEEHLDALCDRLAASFLGEGDQIVGTSYIDHSLVQRFKNKGFPAGIKQDQLLDQEAGPSLEERLAQLEGDANGPGADSGQMFIARHILDHARNIDSFLGNFTGRMNEGDRVYFEVPSSAPFFEPIDPLLLWESHANYFTERSLKNVIEAHGLTVDLLETITANEMELLILLAVKNSAKDSDSSDSPAGDVSSDQFEAFADGFHEQRQRIQTHFKQLRDFGKTIALLGAGHMGNLFINLFEVGAYFDFAIDDDPRKSGLFLPGSELEIFPKEILQDRPVDYLVLSVNRNIEAKVADRFREIVPGMQFGSIFQDSRYSVL